MTATYLRLSRSRRNVARSHGSMPISMAFVDPVLDWPVTPTAVDQLLLGASSVIFDNDLVVIRAPAVSTDELGDSESLAARLVDTLRNGRFGTLFTGAIGVLDFRPGAEPILVSDTNLDRYETLAALRELELTSLLDWGSAVWRLRGAHFRLPNGRHSRTFVRVEHALQSVRDVEVLADWVAIGLRQDAGLLLDSSSVLSLGFRLDVLARQAGLGPLRVRSLSHYPSGFDEVAESVEDALVPGGRGGVIALITASASGRLTGYLAHKLDELGVPRSQIHLLVERSETGTTSITSPSTQDLPNVWMVLPHEDEDDEDCLVCTSPTDAPLVLIDPRTYDPFPFPLPTLEAPDEVPMYVNRSLLRLSTATHAIDVGLPSADADAPRDRQRMGVRFSYDRLFSTDDTAIDLAMQESVRHLELLAQRNSEIELALQHVRKCEVLVYREREFSGGSGDRVRFASRRLLAALGMSQAELVALRQVGQEYFVEPTDLSAIDGRTVGMLHVGLVTGWNTRRALEFMRSLPEVRSDLSALVLHARPESYDVWRAIRELFGGRCLSLWQTPLPWGSPLEEERRLIERFAATSAEAASNPFLVRRLAVTTDGWSGHESKSGPLFWSDLDAEPITTTSSPFGSSVDSASAFAAAGSAVGMARYRALHGPRPAWVAIDIRHLVIERYDVLSLVGVLRWLRAGEGWWGSSPTDVRHTAELVVSLVHNSEAPILGLSELLLACALGKVPTEAHAVFAHEAATRVNGGSSLDAAQQLLAWVKSLNP